MYLSFQDSADPSEDTPYRITRISPALGTKGTSLNHGNVELARYPAGQYTKNAFPSRYLRGTTPRRSPQSPAASNTVSQNRLSELRRELSPIAKNSSAFSVIGEP